MVRAKLARKGTFLKSILANVPMDGSSIGRKMRYVNNAVRIAYHVRDQTIVSIANKVSGVLPTDAKKLNVQMDNTLIQSFLIVDIVLRAVVNVLLLIDAKFAMKGTFLKKLVFATVRLEGSLIGGQEWYVNNVVRIAYHAEK